MDLDNTEMTHLACQWRLSEERESSSEGGHGGNEMEKTQPEQTLDALGQPVIDTTLKNMLLS